MDKKYIVKVKDVNDDNIILAILDFGTVDYVSQHTNVCSVTMDSSNVKKLKQCEGILSVNESRLGKWIKGLKAN